MEASRDPGSRRPVGTLIAGHMPYGVVSILLALVVTVGIIFALRSTVAPAISAAVLPIVLGVTTERKSSRNRAI